MLTRLVLPLTTIAVDTRAADSEQASNEGAPATAAATERTGWLIGGYFAAFVPFGAWTTHPYAGKTLGGITYDEGLSYFGPGWGGSLEIGGKVARSAAITVDMEMTGLSTAEWDRAAQRAGSNISSHVAQFGGHVFGVIRLFHQRPWWMEARMGVGLLHVWGGEDNYDYAVSYDYSFLGAAFSLRGGVGGAYEVSRGVDLTLLLDVGTAVPGVHYSFGSAMPYFDVAAFIGPRVWLRDVGGK